MTGAELAIGKAFFDVFKWAWEKFPAKEICSKFKHQSAAEVYAKKMEKRYGQMQLWKMSAPTSVEKIFTQVNILKKQSAFQNIPKEKLEQIYLNQTGFGEVIESGKDGMTAVRDHDHLFILGKPGAGKTTFLKHVTLEAIAGKLEAIPIFVRLRDFSESKQDLMDFIIAQFDICGFPDALPFIETILKKGKAIVLFDGLDEVNREGGLRKKVIQSLRNFSDKFDQSKILITCRVAATEYNFEGFTTVEMADFNDEQIRTFVKQWFAENSKTSDAFFKAFAQHEGSQLRDLAKNPLLLTLLCISFEETLHFSERRSEIYGEALDTLLKKRDSSRGINRDTIYTKLSLPRKHQMFARIAAETFDKGEYLFEKKALKKKIEEYLKNLPPADKDEEIDGEAILRDIEAQHGIFVERAKGIYSFAHLSFQEYYTAQYTAAHHKHLQRLIPYHADSRWREVFLLTAEMLDDADDFFDLFIGQLDEYVSGKGRLHSLLVRENHDSFGERKHSFSLILLSAIDIPSGFVGERTRRRVLGIAHALRPPDLALALVSAYLQTHSDRWYKFALRRSKEEGYEACHSSLAKLSFPPQNPSFETWKIFTDAVFQIFKTTFKVEDYNFTNMEWEHIFEYLEVTKLLLDCLKVAHVSDHAAIEDRLLRPPKN